MSDKVESRVCDIASDVFAEPREKVNTASSQATLARWDSIQHLNFVLALEETFDLRFTLDEAEKISSVAAAIAVIKSKQDRMR